MYTINRQEYTFTYEVNKSTFISFLKYIENTTEAKQYINLLKEKYPDATHHVSAFIVGSSGQNGGTNDDGEPSGTAGAPIFEVLRKNNLTNIICVVIRYFGGIKLGAGGLVRAYSKAASEVVKIAKLEPIIIYTILKLSFSYPYLNQIEKIIKDFQIIGRSFTSNITITIKVPVEKVTMLSSLLNSLTYGNIIVSEIANNPLDN